MISRRARTFLAAIALSLGAAAGAPSSARADATADQRAAAQALFDDARRLMGDKHYAEACPKLEESQRLDPGLGTLLNLAECQALTGRTASAWANFLEAAYQAKAAGQSKRENTARGRAAALEARLSRLTILAVTGGARIEIKRDGAPVASSLIGTSVPVDRGEHLVTATAPGKKPFESKVIVKPEGHQVTISIPQLEDAPNEPPPVKPPPATPLPEVKPPPPEVTPPPAPSPPPPPAPLPDVSAGKGPRSAGVVLTVLGAGGLGVAAVFTALTKMKLDDSNGPGGCVGNVCPQTAFDARNTARTYGNVATGAWIGGGVVTATGLGLLIAAGVMKDRALAAATRAALVVPAAAIVPGRGATLGLTGRF